VNIEDVQETSNIGDSTLDVMSSGSEIISNVQNIVQESQEQLPLVLRKSTRESRQLKRYLGLHEILMLDSEDPINYKEAMEMPDSNE
jgi:hypothetical protein